MNHQSCVEHHQPSHLPNFRYSSKVHFRLGFPSASPFSLSFPLSILIEDTLEVLCRGWLALPPRPPLILGGGIGNGLLPDLGLPGRLPGSGEDVCDPLSPGSLSLYHPPVYVNATSWCSKCVRSFSSTGACIQPTTHLSSSAMPLDCDRIEVDDKAMCDCCDGMLYVACDHSELNILKGRGKNGVRGESLECRFLREIPIQTAATDMGIGKNVRCARSGYQGENVNGTLITPHTQLLLVRSKRDTVDLGLV